jgi:rpsU-divergently transcribed protein
MIYLLHTLIRYPAATHRIFPGGPQELVEFFLHKKRREALQVLSEHKINQQAPLNPQEELLMLMFQHLRCLSSHRETWPEAVSVLMEPGNILQSANALLELCTDFSNVLVLRTPHLDWYTERMKLLTIYCSAGCI